jgi:hypothetical protein
MAGMARLGEVVLAGKAAASQSSLLKQSCAPRAEAPARSEGTRPCYHDRLFTRPAQHFRRSPNLDALAADIKANGLVEPITMLDGTILDGRCRWDACARAGVEPHAVQYRGSDPVGFVVSMNLKRRHLDESQRAMVAARLATLKDGQRQVGKFADVPTQAQAAERLKVSERSVRDARTVLDHGSPDLTAKVDKGEVAVSHAAKIIRLQVPVRTTTMTICAPMEVRPVEDLTLGTATHAAAAAEEIMRSLRHIGCRNADYEPGAFIERFKLLGPVGTNMVLAAVELAGVIRRDLEQARLWVDLSAEGDGTAKEEGETDATK